jgi:outer membrane autotransporter protein
VLSGVIQDGGLSGGSGGSLIKTGTGTLTLSGSNTYTGGTTIKSGTLEIGDANNPTAKITGSVTVNSGGILAGHGTIGGNVVNSGGAMSPGGSIGTLTVQGNYIQDGGSFVVELGPTAASRLNVGGTASLSNATLSLTFDPGTYPLQSYTLLRSAGLTGGFTTVNETGLPATRAVVLTTTATDAVLAVIAAPIATDTPSTPNQQHVATVLNDVFANPSGDLLAMHDALLRLDAVHQRQALTEISGVTYSSAAPLVVSQVQMTNDLVLGRLFGEGATAGLAIDQQVLPRLIASVASGEYRFPSLENPVAAQGGMSSFTGINGFWLQGGGNWASIDSSANAPGLSASGGNVVAGYDTRVNERARIGAAFDYGHSNSNETGTGATMSVDAYSFVGYGSYRADDITIGGALGFGLEHFDAVRPVALSGTNPIATSSHDGHQVSAAIKAEYPLRMQALSVVPFVSLDYMSVHQDSFTETGAGGLNLSVQPRHFDSLQPEAGLRLGRQFVLDDGTLITPEAHAGLRYEVLDTAATSSSILTSSAASGAFIAQGVSLDRTAVHVGGRLAIHAQPSLDIILATDTRLSGNERIATVGLGLNFRF